MSRRLGDIMGDGYQVAPLRASELGASASTFGASPEAEKQRDTARQDNQALVQSAIERRRRERLDNQKRKQAEAEETLKLSSAIEDTAMANYGRTTGRPVAKNAFGRVVPADTEEQWQSQLQAQESVAEKAAREARAKELQAGHAKKIEAVDFEEKQLAHQLNDPALRTMSDTDRAKAEETANAARLSSLTGIMPEVEKRIEARYGDDKAAKKAALDAARMGQFDPDVVAEIERDMPDAFAGERTIRQQLKADDEIRTRRSALEEKRHATAGRALEERGRDPLDVAIAPPTDAFAAAAVKRDLTARQAEIAARATDVETREKAIVTGYEERVAQVQAEYTTALTTGRLTKAEHSLLTAQKNASLLEARAAAEKAKLDLAADKAKVKIEIEEFAASQRRFTEPTAPAQAQAQPVGVASPVTPTAAPSTPEESPVVDPGVKDSLTPAPVPAPAIEEDKKPWRLILPGKEGGLDAVVVHDVRSMPPGEAIAAAEDAARRMGRKEVYLRPDFATKGADRFNEDAVAAVQPLPVEEIEETKQRATRIAESVNKALEDAADDLTAGVEAGTMTPDAARAAFEQRQASGFDGVTAELSEIQNSTIGATLEGRMSVGQMRGIMESMGVKPAQTDAMLAGVMNHQVQVTDAAEALQAVYGKENAAQKKLGTTIKEKFTTGFDRATGEEGAAGFGRFIADRQPHIKLLNMFRDTTGILGGDKEGFQAKKAESMRAGVQAALDETMTARESEAAAVLAQYPDLSDEEATRLKLSAARQALATSSKGLEEVLAGIAEAPASKLPFVGDYVATAMELAPVVQAAMKVKDGQELSQSDEFFLEAYIEDAGRDHTVLGLAGEILAEMPAFMGEIYLTGGVGTAARKGTGKLARKIVGTEIAESVTKWAATRPKSVRFLGRGVASVYGTTAQTPLAMQDRIATDILTKMTIPDLEGFDGDVQAWIKQPGMDFGPAMGQAMFDSWTEMVAETSGPLISATGRAVARTVMPAGLRNRLAKASWVKAAAKLNNTVATSAIGKFARRANFGGPIEEILEERMGDVISATGNWISGGAVGEEFSLPTAEQWAAEAIAMTIPNAAFAVANARATAQAKRASRALFEQNHAPVAAFGDWTDTNAVADGINGILSGDATVAPFTAADIEAIEAEIGPLAEMPALVKSREIDARLAERMTDAENRDDMAGLGRASSMRITRAHHEAGKVVQTVLAHRYASQAVATMKADPSPEMQAEAARVSGAQKIAAGRPLAELTAAERAVWIPEPTVLPDGSPVVEPALVEEVNGKPIITDAGKASVAAVLGEDLTNALLPMAEAKARRLALQPERKTQKWKSSPSSPSPSDSPGSSTSSPTPSANTTTATGTTTTPTRTEWRGRGANGTVVTLPADAATSLADAERQMAAKLPLGEMIEPDSVEPPAMPNTREPAAAAPVSPLREAITAQAASLEPGQRKMVDDVVTTLERIGADANVFTGVDVDFSFESPLGVRPDGTLVINPSLAGQIRTPEQLVAGVIEEVIHSAAFRIDQAAIAQVWQSLPAKLKNQVIDAYTYNNPEQRRRVTSKFTDTMWGHEFLRMVIQDRAFRGMVTEAMAANPSFAQELLDLLQSLVDAIRSLAAGLDPAARLLVEARVSDIVSVMRAMGVAVSEESAAPTETTAEQTPPASEATPEVNPLEVYTAWREGEDTAAAAGLSLNKGQPGFDAVFGAWLRKTNKPDVWDALSDTEKLDLAVGAILSQRWRARIAPGPLAAHLQAFRNADVPDAVESLLSGVLPQRAAAAETKARKSAINPLVDDGTGPAPDAQRIVGAGDSPAEVPTREPRLRGSTGTAFTSTGEPIEYQWAVVEAGDPVTSHNDDLSKNKGYNQELQGRNRDSAASEANITDIEGNTTFARLSDSSDTASGAPILGPDLAVESGNGRTIAMRRAYKKGRANVSTYKAELVSNANKFGFDPAAVEQLTAPILVRVRISEVDRVAFAEDANRSTVATLSDKETALQDARGLPASLLEQLDVSPDGDLYTPANRAFFRQFFSRNVSKGELPGLVTDEGQLTKSGLDRVRNAVFVAAYGNDARAMRLFDRLVEEIDADQRNIVNAMVASAPEMARHQAAAAAGAQQATTFPEDLLTAANELIQSRAEGQTAEEWLSQALLFDEGMTPMQRQLFLFMDGNMKSAKRLATGFRNVLALIQQAGDPREVDLFGDAPEFDLATTVRDGLARESLVGSMAQEEMALGMGGEGPARTATAKERTAIERTIRRHFEVMEDSPGEFRVLADQTAASALKGFEKGEYGTVADALNASLPRTFSDAPKEVQRDIKRRVAARILESQAYDAQFQEAVRDISADGDDFWWPLHGPVKKFARSAEKAIEEWEMERDDSNPDFSVDDAAASLKDLVRASVIVQDAAEFDAALEAIGKRFKIARVKNRWENPLAGGYADILVNVETPTGLAEIQLHIPEMIVAKEGWFPGLPEGYRPIVPIAQTGHQLYEEQRKIAGHIPGARERIDALNELMFDLYSSALRAHWERTNSRPPVLSLNRVFTSSQVEAESLRLTIFSSPSDPSRFIRRIRLPRNTAGMSESPRSAGSAPAGTLNVTGSLTPEYTITAENIQDFSGKVDVTGLIERRGRWQDAFDFAAPVQSLRVVPISKLVSHKNELLDPKFRAGKKIDPRQNAANWMVKAMDGEAEAKKRAPLDVYETGDGTFTVIDGNATFQAAAIAGWPAVPVNVVDKPAALGMGAAPSSETDQLDLFSYQPPSGPAREIPRTKPAPKTPETLAFQGNLFDWAPAPETSTIANDGNRPGQLGPRRPGATTGGSELAENPQRPQDAGAGIGDLFAWGGGPTAKPKSPDGAGLGGVGGIRGEQRPQRGEGDAATGEADRPGDRDAGDGAADNRPVGDSSGGLSGDDPGLTPLAPLSKPKRDTAPGEKPLLDRPTDPAARNFVLPDGFEPSPGGAKARIEANFRAIHKLRELEDEGREATPEEKLVLVRYTGWGSFKEPFAKITYDDAKRRVENVTRSHGEDWFTRDYEEKTYSYSSYGRQNYRPEEAFFEAQRWLNNHAELHERLVEELTPQEFDAAFMSIMNAHFTAAPIVDAVWDMARKAGFRGGKAMEPAAGVGHFIGRTPADLADRTEWNAVELDEITAKILGKLYPEARVNSNRPDPTRIIGGQGFESARIPNNSLDLMISNVPFDADGPGQSVSEFGIQFNLHNYFFARALSKVKPGGLVVFITTHNSMDASIDQRKWLAEHSEFVHAVRLPSTAFKKTAGTEVVTDIIVLRKPDGSGVAPVNESWTLTTDVGAEEVEQTVALSEKGKDLTKKAIGEGLYKIPHDWQAIDPEIAPLWDAWAVKRPGSGPLHKALVDALAERVEAAPGKREHWNRRERVRLRFKAVIRANEFFARNPDAVVGTHSLAGSMYGENEYTVKPPEGGEDAYYAAVNKAVALTPEVGQALDTGEDIEVASDAGDREGSFVERDGKFFQVFRKTLIPMDWKPSQEALYRSWAKALVAVENLLILEQSPETDAARLDAARATLNRYFDQHVAQYGHPANPNARTNNHRHLIADSSGYALIQSLEEPVKDIGQDGKVTYTYEKAPIMERRVLKPLIEPTKAETVVDAYKFSMAYRGRIDSGFVARLLGITEDEANSRLLNESYVYEDPLTGLLVDADEYLSGNVVTKFLAAEAAAKEDSRYERNAAALAEVRPPLKQASKISFQIGAVWIPNEVYDAFAREFLQIGDGRTRVEDQVKQFVGSGGSRDWGTDDMSAAQIFKSLIEDKSIAIYHGRGDDRVFSASGTEAARAKAEEMRREFGNWVRSSPVEVDGRVVAEIAAEEYNRTVNVLRPPTFIGEWVDLPDQSGEIFLTPHRKAVIARFLTQGYGMMAHGVGSGKTYALIALAHEMKRLGKANKIVIVAMNPTVEQFAASYKKAYPQARLLIANPKGNFDKSRRAQFYSQMATGDFDAIILPHSTLKQIPHTPAAIQAHFDLQLEELMETLRAVVASGDKKAANTIRAAIKKLREKMKARMDKAEKNRDEGAIEWEKMGIDALLVDEAHAFKNAPVITKMKRIKNLPTGEASDNALSMMMKAVDVQKRRAGKNVFFATGTPITNTMGEAYVMLRYLAPESLKDLGILTFDDFARTFAITETNPEATWRGKVQMTTRLTDFVNGQALVNLIRSVFDVAIGNEKLGLDVPKVKGGGPRQILVKQTPVTQVINDWILDIVDAYEALDPKDIKDDKQLGAIPIVTMQAGLAAATDPRLIDPNAPDDPNSKVNVMVEDIMRIYDAGKERKITQAIFSDLRKPFKTKLLLDKGMIDSLPYGGEIKGFEDNGKESESETDEDADDDSDNRFDLFEDIKAKLVARGVPASEIWWPTTEKQETLADKFQAVNDGEIRIIMGGTSKIGTGVNFQELLGAVHHLSPPRDMKPAMLEQRNGRIIRQGNNHAEWAHNAFVAVVEEASGQKFEGKNPKKRRQAAEAWIESSGREEVKEIADIAASQFDIEILYYALENSTDSSVFSMMGAKQGMIGKVMSDSVAEDEFSDPAAGVKIAMAEFAAKIIGDTDLIRMIELERTVQSLRLKARNHAAAVANKRFDIREAKSRLEWIERAETARAKLPPNIENLFDDPKALPVWTYGQFTFDPYDKKKETPFIGSLERWIADLRSAPRSYTLTVGPVEFTVQKYETLRRDGPADGRVSIVVGDQFLGTSIIADRGFSSAKGLVQQIHSLVRDVASQSRTDEATKARILRDLPAMQAEDLDAPFAEEAELRALETEYVEVREAVTAGLEAKAAERHARRMARLNRGESAEATPGEAAIIAMVSNAAGVSAAPQVTRIWSEMQERREPVQALAMGTSPYLDLAADWKQWPLADTVMDIAGIPAGVRPMMRTRPKMEPLVRFAGGANALETAMGKAGIAMEKPVAQMDRVDLAARQTETNPTEGQKQAGNYKMGKVTIQGLPISIENPRGSERRGTDASGKEWSVEMAHHYGYIRRFQAGKDGDHVDVFIGPDPDQGTAYVVNQKKGNGQFDEHKVMLGFASPKDAAKGYRDSYSPGWKGLGSMVPVSIDGLKTWLESGDMGKPFAASDALMMGGYHGTPHKVDRFSVEKIGTGEGNQAYGWGLYFAEDPEVAKDYQEKLGRRTFYDSFRYDNTNPRHVAASFVDTNGSVGSAIDRARALLSSTPDRRGPQANLLRKVAQALETGDYAKRTEENSGNLYRVDIKADPETEFLDWDKPLSEQSEKIKVAFAKFGMSTDAMTWRGEALYHHFKINHTYGGSQESASRMLFENGIKGIRYLDGNSRTTPGELRDAEYLLKNRQESLERGRAFAAKSGTSVNEDGISIKMLEDDVETFAKKLRDLQAKQQTRNFVVFDDSLVEILEENGKPVSRKVREQTLALAMGANSAAEADPRGTDDETAIRNALDYLSGKLPSQKDLTARRAEALVEADGERTIGNPEIANIFEADRDRREFDVIREAYEESRKGETHEQWNESAQRLVKRDPEGVIRALVETAREGVSIDTPVLVKAAQILVPRIWREALASGDTKAIRDAQSLMLAYQMGGTVTAQALGARRDPFKSREDRHLEFLADMISKVSPETMKKAKAAKTPAAKSREIDRLTRELAEARKNAADKSEIARLGKELAEVRKAKDRAEILGAAHEERLERVKQVLAEMGVSLHDIFSRQAVVRLRGSEIVARVIEEHYSKPQRAAIRAIIQEQLSASQIKKKTGIPVAEVKNLKADFMAKIKGRFVELAKRGLTLADFQHTDAGMFNVSERISEEGDVLRMGYSSNVSDEAAEAAAEEMMDALFGGPKGGKGGGSRPGGTSESFDPGNRVHVARVARTVHAAVDANVYDMVFEYWINNILGGPQTHAVNIIGNSLNIALEYGMQRLFEAGFNTVVGDKDGATIGEYAWLQKAVPNAWAQGFRYAMQTWATEESFLERDVLNDPADIDPDMDKSGGSKRAIPDRIFGVGTQGAKDLPGAILDAARGKGWGGVSVGKTVRIPGRALLFMDTLMKGVVGFMEVSGQAYRRGAAEGLTGKALDKYVRGEANTPGSDSWHAAMLKANEMTFTTRLRGAVVKDGGIPGGIVEQLVKKLQEARRAGGTLGAPAAFMVGFIFPFIQTPFNIFKSGLRRTPFGLAGIAKHLIESGLYSWRNGGPVIEHYTKARLNRDLADQTISLIATAILLAITEGDDDDDDKPILVTGSRPWGVDTSGERGLLDRTEGGAFQIRLGKAGPDAVYFDYGRMEPFATIIASIADSVRSINRMKNGADKVAEMTKMRAYALSQAQDKTFLQGITKINEIMNPGQSAGKNLARNVAQFIVPNIIRQPLRNLDDYVRETKTAPWYYHALPLGGFAESKYDLYGNPLEKAPAPLLPGKAGSVGRILLDTNLEPNSPRHPADIALREWNRRNPAKGDQYFPSDNSIYSFKDLLGTTHKLTARQLAEVNRQGGQRLAIELAQIITPAETLNPTQETIAKIEKARRAVFTETRDRIVNTPLPPRRPSRSLSELLGWDNP